MLLFFPDVLKTSVELQAKRIEMHIRLKHSIMHGIVSCHFLFLLQQTSPAWSNKIFCLWQLMNDCDLQCTTYFFCLFRLLFTWLKKPGLGLLLLGRLRFFNFFSPLLFPSAALWMESLGPPVKLIEGLTWSILRGTCNLQSCCIALS